MAAIIPRVSNDPSHQALQKWRSGKGRAIQNQRAIATMKTILILLAAFALGFGAKGAVVARCIGPPGLAPIFAQFRGDPYELGWRVPLSYVVLALPLLIVVWKAYFTPQ
jgi:hypothetical protein